MPVKDDEVGVPRCVELTCAFKGILSHRLTSPTWDADGLASEIGHCSYASQRDRAGRGVRSHTK